MGLLCPSMEKPAVSSQLMWFITIVGDEELWNRCREMNKDASLNIRVHRDMLDDAFCETPQPRIYTRCQKEAKDSVWKRACNVGSAVRSLNKTIRSRQLYARCRVSGSHVVHLQVCSGWMGL